MGLTLTDEGVVRPFTDHEKWPMRPTDLLPDGVLDQIVQVNGWLYFITADGSLEAFDSRDPRYIPLPDEYMDDDKPNPACRHFGGTGIGCPDCEAEDRENAEAPWKP